MAHHVAARKALPVWGFMSLTSAPASRSNCTISLLSVPQLMQACVSEVRSMILVLLTNTPLLSKDPTISLCLPSQALNSAVRTSSSFLMFIIVPRSSRRSTTCVLSQATASNKAVFLPCAWARQSGTLNDGFMKRSKMSSYFGDLSLFRGRASAFKSFCKVTASLFDLISRLISMSSSLYSFKLFKLVNSSSHIFARSFSESFAILRWSFWATIDSAESSSLSPYMLRSASCFNNNSTISCSPIQATACSEVCNLPPVTLRNPFLCEVLRC